MFYCMFYFTCDRSFTIWRARDRDHLHQFYSLPTPRTDVIIIKGRGKGCRFVQCMLSTVRYPSTVTLPTIKSSQGAFYFSVAIAHRYKNKQETPAVADKPARRLKPGSGVTQGHRK